MWVGNFITLREEHRLKMSENRREYLDLRECSNMRLEQTVLWKLHMGLLS
jgi:hypothetical protein